MKREKTHYNNCGRKMYPRKNSIVCSSCFRKSMKAIAKSRLMEEEMERG
jgi:hypothetical protein